MSRKTYRLPTRMPLKCPARECPKTAYEFPPNAHVNALPMPSSKCPKMNSNVQDRLQNAHANALEMPCSGPSASASTTSPKRNLNAYEYPPKVRGTAKYIVECEFLQMTLKACSRVGRDSVGSVSAFQILGTTYPPLCRLKPWKLRWKINIGRLIP